jgi:hypothetical protein
VVAELEEGGAGLEILDIEAMLTLLYSLYYKLKKIFNKLAPLRKKFRKSSMKREYYSI